MPADSRSRSVAPFERSRVLCLLGLTLTLAVPAPARAQSPPLQLRKGDRIVLLGNTMAERMAEYNHFETMLTARFADLELVVRNLGWSGDTLTLQPRPLNFGDAARHLREQRPDVIIAFFGLNESFEGEAGLPKFDKDLTEYLAAHLAEHYNGKGPPRVVLVSPMAHERLARLERYVDVDARNRELARYTEVMLRVAAAHGVTFADLFTPTRRQSMLAAAEGNPSATASTINGIHLNEAGDRGIASLLMGVLGLGPAEYGARGNMAGPVFESHERLRELIRQKNQLFFYRWRPVNAEYVVGRRVEPFGAVNFPPEMRELDEMIGALEQKIWAAARAPRGARGGGGQQ